MKINYMLNEVDKERHTESKEYEYDGRDEKRDECEGEDDGGQ